MSLRTFGKSLRNVRNRIQIQANVLRGREFVPSHGGKLFVETSSICNLECRFCAYFKKQSPKVTMEDAFFIDTIEQALRMGLRMFHLTPCTGDVFMDRTLFEKLAFLDAHPEVEGYDFFTNFTIPSSEDIERLLGLRKLKSMKISLYGHDEESFVAITQSTPKVYGRLIKNLEYLFPRLDRCRFLPSLGLRSTRDAGKGPPSALWSLMERYREAGVHVWRTGVYNNWGGYITQDDVQGLAIDITDDRSTFKKGACTLLFTGVQVMATGIVNGCACRDVDATLRIGDLHEEPLAEILSPRNPRYRQLIEEQQAGHFRPVCQSCDFYKSIYRTTRVHRRRGGLRTLDEFLEQPYVLPRPAERAATVPTD